MLPRKARCLNVVQICQILSIKWESRVIYEFSIRGILF